MPTCLSPKQRSAVLCTDSPRQRSGGPRTGSPSPRPRNCVQGVSNTSEVLYAPNKSVVSQYPKVFDGQGFPPCNRAMCCYPRQHLVNETYPPGQQELFAVFWGEHSWLLKDSQMQRSSLLAVHAQPGMRTTSKKCSCCVLKSLAWKPCTEYIHNQVLLPRWYL